jgi:hypothetical protein
MLEWSIAASDDNATIGYMQATPGGIFATNNDTGSVYNIADVAGLSASQGPAVSAVAAYSAPYAAANVLAVGSDGNLWTATDNTTGNTPDLPPVLAKVIYSAPLGIVSLSSIRRATATFKHTATGKHFPVNRIRRGQRRARFSALYGSKFPAGTHRK